MTEAGAERRQASDGEFYDLAEFHIGTLIAGREGGRMLLLGMNVSILAREHRSRLQQSVVLQSRFNKSLQPCPVNSDQSARLHQVRA